MRNWNELIRRHTAFWECGETDRPLVVALYQAYQDTALVAEAFGQGELLPERIDSAPLLPVFDRMAAAHEQIEDDFIASGEPLLGIPWLEAICGCRVKIPDGKSIWAETPASPIDMDELQISPDNPWFQSLVNIIQQVVNHAQGRYPISMSHLRGPTDILAALMGTNNFLMSLVDEPDRMKRLAVRLAEIYVQVAHAQERLIPGFYQGYVIRQFGIWSPGRSVWLQDDTSSMISLRRYTQVFLEPMARMSVFPYGVLHLHAPSLHLAELLACVRNIRAVNIYFDSPGMSLEKAFPTLKKLQEKNVPLILAKDVYQGFALEEYQLIVENLSPRGLSIHMKAGSIDEGREVLARVSEWQKRYRRSYP